MPATNSQGNWDSSGILIDEYNRGIPGSMLARNGFGFPAARNGPTRRAKHIVARATALSVRCFWSVCRFCARRAAPRCAHVGDGRCSRPAGGNRLGACCCGWAFCSSFRCTGFSTAGIGSRLFIFNRLTWLLALVAVPVLIYFAGHDNRQRRDNAIRFGVVFAVL